MEYDELSNIAFKYGTDKCPQLFHPYTPYYYELFKDKRNEVKKVIEAGIGYWKGMTDTDETTYDKNLDRTYQKGASLKMWRDFFPNAHIYGFDYKTETMFNSDRITTFVVDERKKEQVEKLISIVGSDVDLFIDDALHTPKPQINLCKWAMPLLDKNVTYVIEDVKFAQIEEITKALSEYKTEVPSLEKTPRNQRGKHTTYLITVRNKK